MLNIFGDTPLSVSPSEVSVGGAVSILYYEHDRIAIRLNTLDVVIRGSSLELDTYLRTGAVIRGDIESVAFER